MKGALKGSTASSCANGERPSLLTLETLAEAEARNLRLIDQLVDRELDIAVAIEACCPDARCGLVACAVCSRRFRFQFIRELVRLARSYAVPHQIATIFIETIPAGSLKAASVKRAQDRLRKQLQRAGFASSILAGGAEVGWDNASGIWVLHVHALAIGVPAAAWAKLRWALRNSGTAFPLVVQPLRDVRRQVSYLLKFATYHRPLRRDGKGRSPAVPLPPARLAELAAWRVEYRFEDFVFLRRAKRHGGRIVPDAGSG